MHHLERFFLVARLFDKYFNVELKIFLGIFFCTFDQRLVVLREAYYIYYYYIIIIIITHLFKVGKNVVQIN